MASSLAGLLEQLGHEVRIATNAPRGLRLVASFRADLVLIDIVLPVFDGNDIAAEIRSHAAEPPRLVALTGVPERVKRELFDDCLKKPVTAAELTRVLAEVEARS